MIEEIKYDYKLAFDIASIVMEELLPHCDRIEIAGSLRRKKSKVKDIEIVAIPKPYQTGLFQNGIASVVNKWPKIKGELDGSTKYTQRILPEGIKLDLFLAEPGNWGLIFAIRTGSAEYSHKVLATSWVKIGYTSKEGYLWKEGKRYEIKEEKELFSIIGISYIDPWKRNL